MSVQNDPVQISPYTSTVPLINIPPDAISGQTRPDQPLQGQYGKKGTGALAIGDSLLKGFMLGHQMKEQKRQAQAQATINAADAASESAYQEYQTALTNAGGNQNDPKAQAAYQAYVTAFNAGKQAKAQFVIPEKTQKGRKAAAGDTDPVKSPDDKKKKNPVSAGFNSIKDFFEANPHIIPQLALVTMQPKPPGLSPEGQQQVQNLESQRLANQETQQRQQDLQTYSTGRAIYDQLSPDQIREGMKDPKWATAYQAWDAARTRLTPIREGDKDRVWTNGTDFISLPIGQAPPPGAGYRPYEKTPTNESQTNMYYDAAARAWGTTRDKLTVQQLEYVDAMRARTKAQSSGQTTYSYSTTDVKGNRSTVTRKISEPVPKPPGVTDLPDSVFQQGIQPPPGGSQASSAAAGGIGPPPTAGAASTAQGVPPTAPQGSTQFTVGTKPKGMVEEGNLPIWNRPTVQNGDGSHSSEYSTSFEQDGKEVLVPTVVNGKFLTPDGKKPKPGSPEEKAMFKAAWQHYLDTGENLGKFDNAQDADAYANILHNRGSAKRSGQKLGPPPQAAKTAKPAGRGGISRLPGAKETATTAAVTRQAVTKQQEGYRKAEAAYTKALADADKAYAAAQKTAASTGDQSILQTAQGVRDAQRKLAQAQLDAAKTSVAAEYDAAVRSIGGNTGDQQQQVRYYQGHPYVQDPQTGEWKLQQGQ